MKKNLALFLALAMSASAGTMWFGTESHLVPDNDYMDRAFSLTGNFSVSGSNQNGEWQPLGAYVLNENCLPFFDCPSYAGHQRNFGYFVTGTDGWYGPNDPLNLSPAISQSALEFFGDANGNNSGFFIAGTGSVTLTQLFAAQTTELDYVDLGDNSIHKLLDPSTQLGLVTTFTIPSSGFAFLEITTADYGPSAPPVGTQYRSDQGTLGFAVVQETPEPATFFLLTPTLFFLLRRKKS